MRGDGPLNEYEIDFTTHAAHCLIHIQPPYPTVTFLFRFIFSLLLAHPRLALPFTFFLMCLPTRPHLSHLTPFSLCLCPATKLPSILESSPLPFLPSPPCCLLVFLSHVFTVSLFLNHMSFSLALSVPPSLHLSRRSAVIWTDVSAELIIPSSCCLPNATPFPSCVTVTLPPFPSASPCHSHRLSPSLHHLSLHHVRSPSPPLSSLPFPSLLQPSLLFPSETGLSGRFSHLSTSSLMLFRLHVCVCVHATLTTHLYLCVSDKGKRWGKRVRVLRMTTAELFSFDLEADMKGIKSPEKERH